MKKPRFAPAPPQPATRIWRQRTLAMVIPLFVATSLQAASVRPVTMPDPVAPAISTKQARSRGVTPIRKLAQAPEIQLPRQQRTLSGPAPGSATIPGPKLDVGALPVAPALQPEGSKAAHLDASLQREIARLTRVAQPRSGPGTSREAANAAWILGLIELHGGIAPSSPRQAQTWFEHATRYGRLPLANAGLAWCYIDGCSRPVEPSSARQAIERLRPAHPARALYLQWLLDSRLQPLTARVNDPEGISRLRLPLRHMLEKAASQGDSQARVELGLEAVTNGELDKARGYFQAAARNSRAAQANLELLDQAAHPQRQTTTPRSEAEDLLERARRAHRGAGGPANYAEALRLYQLAAAKGNRAAQHMLALISSRRQPDGTVNLAWMSQLAWLDTTSNLPRLDVSMLSRLMYRDPTPLFDLLPERWQQALTRIPG